MNHYLQKVLGVAALTMAGFSAHAATVSVVPSAVSVAVGSTFNVTISIADLIGSGAPSLGAFDLDIQFDSAILGYAGFSWGDSVLGDQLDLAHLGSLAYADETNAASGKLNYFEVSYDDVDALNLTQAGNFGLLTLTFNALTNGATPITIGINALSDADGHELAAQIANSSVTVSAVPLPSALPLFASALLLGAGARTRRNK